MAPQRRGLIPSDIAARIKVAVQAAADLDAAVVEALKAGGSVREVQALTGWSRDRVSRVGHDGGWPTKEQVAEREAARVRNAQTNRDLGLDS